MHYLITVYRIPQFQVERSNSVQIYLFESAKNCKIHTTASQSVVLHYPKTGATEEDEWFDMGVAETFLTVIKNDKVHTEALESVE